MKKIKPSDLWGFSENHFTPYTDYSEEIAEWLKENAEFTGRHQSYYDCIFSAGYEFYCHYVKYSHDKYYTNEEFKEWIGMNKKTETVQAFTKADLKDGMICTVRNGNKYRVREDMLIADSGFHIPLGRINSDLTCDKNLTDFDIVQVQYTVTVFQRKDERKQRIEQELEFAKAKAERLASHIAVLESKLK